MNAFYLLEQLQKNISCSVWVNNQEYIEGFAHVSGPLHFKSPVMAVKKTTVSFKKRFSTEMGLLKKIMLKSFITEQKRKERTKKDREKET